jgi:hypothetical protein
MASKGNTKSNQIAGRGVERIAARTKEGERSETSDAGCGEASAARPAAQELEGRGEGRGRDTSAEGAQESERRLPLATTTPKSVAPTRYRYRS